jgi:hypothetical protein
MRTYVRARVIMRALLQLLWVPAGRRRCRPAGVCEAGVFRFCRVLV